jgi:hypothetical protein
MMVKPRVLPTELPYFNDHHEAPANAAAMAAAASNAGRHPITRLARRPDRCS